MDIRVEKDSVDYKRLRKNFIDLYLLRHEWMRELVNETGKKDDQFRRDAEVEIGMPLFPDVSWMAEDAPKFQRVHQQLNLIKIPHQRSNKLPNIQDKRFQCVLSCSMTGSHWRILPQRKFKFSDRTSTTLLRSWVM